MVLNILVTKVNTAYTGAAKVGEYGFDFPITSTAQDLVGCRVYLSSPSGFTAVTPTSEAIPLNQQPHFRPVLLGTIELVDNEPRIKYSTDLGMTETHVPLKM
ncbi:hypothetical protein [Porphyromonas cangingivalis]|nr:hypothetical protein [Porphyromonas cangingivalis]